MIFVNVPAEGKRADIHVVDVSKALKKIYTWHDMVSVAELSEQASVIGFVLPYQYPLPTRPKYLIYDFWFAFLE